MTLNESLNRVLVEWSQNFLRKRISDAKLIGKASGQGGRSFNYSIIKSATSDLVVALFQFEAYLRFADMRKLNWEKEPPLESIIEWVRKKGIENFVDGFSKKNRVPSSDVQLLNKISWGIKIKKKKTSKRKRIRWYNKQKEKDISQLYSDLLDTAAEFTLKEISKTILA